MNVARMEAHREVQVPIQSRPSYSSIVSLTQIRALGNLQYKLGQKTMLLDIVI